MSRSLRATVVAATALSTVLTAALVGAALVGAPADAAGATSPVGISAATYLVTVPDDVAVGPDGTTYVVGSAMNDGSLEHNGAGADRDAFVLAYGIDGALRDSRFLGGTGDDTGNALTVRPDGAVVVAGATLSDDFPTTAGAAGTGKKVGYDAFVTVLSADLSTIVRSAVVGGNATDSGQDVAVDGLGQIWVAADTSSTDLPVTAGPAAPGADNALLLAFGPDLATRPVLRVVGGTDQDSAGGVAGLPGGGAVLVGASFSADFPTVGPGMAGGQAPRGDGDAYAVRVTGTGAIPWATRFGGATTEYALDVDIDAGGDVLVGGTTMSADFPHTSTMPRPGGTVEHGFALRMSSGGDQLRWSTVLGGSDGDSRISAVAFDAHGAAYVAGYTAATDTQFVHPFAPLNAWRDAYVAKLDGSGNTLRWAFPLGGSGADTAKGIALAPDGHVVVAGGTESTDFPVTDGSTLATSEDSGAITWLTSTPTTSALTGPAKTRNRTPRFTFTVDVTGARTECRVDSSAWRACQAGDPGALSFTTPRLKDGRHTVAVRAVDVPGRPGPAVSATVTIDGTAPQTTIRKHPPKTTGKAKVRFSVKSSEKKSTFSCKLDKRAWKRCGATFTVKVKPGKHRLQVRATDALGNTDPTPATFRWKRR